MAMNLQTFMDANHTFLVVISLDYVLKKEDTYYPQRFLKELLNTLRKK